MHVTASKPASAPAAAAAEADEAAEEAVTKQNPGRKPRKASAGAERPAPGTVKLGDSATGQHIQSIEAPHHASHLWRWNITVHKAVLCHFC